MSTRKAYRCRLCGEPKKGHVCLVDAKNLLNMCSSGSNVHELDDEEPPSKMPKTSSATSRANVSSPAPLGAGASASMSSATSAGVSAPSAKQTSELRSVIETLAARTTELVDWKYAMLLHKEELESRIDRLTKSIQQQSDAYRSALENEKEECNRKITAITARAQKNEAAWAAEVARAATAKMPTPVNASARPIVTAAGLGSGRFATSEALEMLLQFVMRRMSQEAGWYQAQTFSEGFYLAKKMLFQNAYLYLEDKLIDDISAKIDANELGDQQSQTLVSMGNMWSDYCGKHVYSHENSRLWINGSQLLQWLRLARMRNLRWMRVVMHGSNDYNAIQVDPCCVDMQRHRRNCAHGPGLYVSVADTITRCYGHQKNTLPVGTGLIGLLLCENPSMVGESIATKEYILKKDSPPSPFYRYTFKLNEESLKGMSDSSKKIIDEAHKDNTCLEAIAVYDTARFLPLGKLVPSGKYIFTINLGHISNDRKHDTQSFGPHITAKLEDLVAGKTTEAHYTAGGHSFKAVVCKSDKSIVTIEQTNLSHVSHTKRLITATPFSQS